MRRIKRKISSSQIIILGFLGAILLGTMLLLLPISTKEGVCAGFMNAFFTATSAVCVTGLIVRDTATYWSSFGQAVILLLIQIGGMGVVTVAVAVFLASGKKISLQQRSALQESISAPQVGGIVRMTGLIIRVTVCCELVGAVIMAPVFCKEFGFAKGVWYALFHSVSAFCNAGFDLMGTTQPDSSLTHYADQPVINLVVMALIVVGGIGFVTWNDVKEHKFHIKKYRMQSKVILVTTTVLIFVPALYLFFFEFGNMPLKERILCSLFQSVTTRTAGFNTADLTQIGSVGLALMTVLMLIGGSPGSTAGGMKTTTVAVMLSNAGSVFMKKEHTHFFGRRIPEDTVRTAATVLITYLVAFLLGGFVICKLESLPLQACLFETASAIGTVGLSLGITPKLSVSSQLILIILMYVGRVGGLTLIFSTINKSGGNTAKFPQEKLTVG